MPKVKHFAIPLINIANEHLQTESLLIYNTNLLAAAASPPQLLLKFFFASQTLNFIFFSSHLISFHQREFLLAMEFSEEVVIEGAEARVARNAFLNMDLIVEVTHSLLHSLNLSLIY
jgi:hypothetical protein